MFDRLYRPVAGDIYYVGGGYTHVMQSRYHCGVDAMVRVNEPDGVLLGVYCH